ncbi:ABC transporter permease [Malacoplasma penetrans]|nr:ABC transporter permease [Malacoplasma penetrans]
MLQLIKQVLKSFKSSILLLIGLFFISFAIVFATFSSLYFSSNISNSYNSLSASSNGNEAFLETKDSELKNNNLSYDFDSLNNLNPIKPNSDGKYFNSLDEYANLNFSFIYPETNLYHSSFTKQSNARNYIFAYYTSSADTNKYFKGDGVNKADSLYKDRARGILASYGNLKIPDSSNQWRAFGLELGNEDLKNIIYEIDPLTGQTAIDANSNYVNTLGYFSDGYISSTITLWGGNLKYPTNVTGTSATDISGKTYRVKNNNTDTPFFVGETGYGKEWWTDQNYDLNGSNLNEIFSKFQTVEQTTDTPDIVNIMSSAYIQSSVALSLDKNIDWNIASLTPYYDYMRIMRDKRYLTQETTGKNQDLIVSVHLDMSKLSTLQRQTFDFVREKYGVQKYIDLTSFLYTVNGQSVKTALLASPNLSAELKKEIEGLSVDSLLPILKQTFGTTTGYEILITWLENYGNEKLITVKKELLKYEREFLSYKELSTFDNFTYKTQKSFTLSDFKTSQSFLVSHKGGVSNPNENNSINDLQILSGSKITNGYDFLSSKYDYLNKEVYSDDEQKTNSTKYEDISNTLLSTTRIGGGSQQEIETGGYSINPNGDYLINLVKFINDSYVTGETENTNANNSSESSKLLSDRIKELAKKIVDHYNGTTANVSGSINVNDYYHLFAMATPQNYYVYTNTDNPDNNSSYIFSNNNQNLEYSFSANAGMTPTTYSSRASLYAPYGNSIVVNEAWLNSNQKSVLPTNQWQKVLLMNSSEFRTWKQNLDGRYKVNINSLEFIIIGSGISFENSFPIVSIESPIPNPRIEGVTYVDDMGYESLLYTNSFSNQDIYFAIRFNYGEKVDLSSLNSLMDSYTKKAYLSSEITDFTNLLTARISYPKLIAIYINLFATILVAVLLVIGIYLSSLLVKIYAEKNKVSLAIAKANGISSIQIAISLSVFGAFAAIISGVVGYLSAFLLQGLFVGILSNFWYIPISVREFSYIGLFSGIACLYIAFLLFSFLGVWKTFRSPINELLSSSEEMKVNKLLYLLKSKKTSFFVLAKFRIALTLSKLTRFILFVVLCSAGLSIIAVGTAIPRKFETSQTNTLENRRYGYSYNLQTPSEQSGLYKVQEYAYLGTNDEAGGIYDIFSNTMFDNNNPYRKLVTSTDQDEKDLLALRDLQGNVIKYSNGQPKYFSNLLLPSYVHVDAFKKDPQLFRNAVVSKWLVDFEISIAGIYVNAWQFVSEAFPLELISRINAISNNFLISVLEVPELKTINDTQNYITRNSSDNYVLNPEKVLDLTNVSDTNSIRFNNEFLKYIGMIYGNTELSSIDAKISFGIVPFRSMETNSLTESYTYLDATLNDPTVRIPSVRNNGKNLLIDINKEIFGIKKDSQFVTLIGDKKNDLNSKLFEPVETEDNYLVYPAVVNKGAAYQYDLEVGDTFKIDVKNSYTRYTDSMSGINPTKSVKLKVVGISSDAFATGIYISQDNANTILGLNFNQGATIIGTSTYGNGTMETTVLGDWSSGVLKPSGTETNANYRIKQVEYPKSYVPFNGVFSKEENPLLVNSLVLENTSGLWGNYSSFTDSGFAGLVSTVGINNIINMAMPYSEEGLSKLATNLSISSNSRNDIITRLSSSMSISSLQTWLQNNFGTPSIVAINSFEYFTTVFDTYITIFNTLISIETLIICLFIPLIIIIVMIISSVMMNDFRRLVAILKTLGYSDKENLLSILVIFVPVVLISLIVGIAIVATLSVSFNFMVFNAASIYLAPEIDWLAYLFGFIAIVGIVTINFIFVALYLKKQNLRNSIS